MTISIKTLLWIGIDNVGLNVLFQKLFPKSKKVKKSKKFIHQKAAEINKDMGDSSDNETSGPVSIGKFVRKMYKTNAMYFDVKTFLYRSFEIRQLTEI